MPYGFKHRDTAKNAASKVRQSPPSLVAQRPVRLTNKHWIIQVPSGGIPGRIADTPGTAKCDVFAVIENGTLAEQTNWAKDASGATQFQIDVYNLSDTAAEAGAVLIAHQVGGYACVEPGGSGGTPSIDPLIQYRIDSPVNTETPEGRWNATILQLHNADDAYNPADPPNPLTVGDTFIVNDPHNHWPTPTLHDSLPSPYGGGPNPFTGSIGWALLRRPSRSNDTPAAGPDNPRYEILTQSLPVDRMRVRVKTCVKWADTTAMVYFNGDAVAKQSDGLNVDFPNDAATSDDSNEGDYMLLVSNDLHLTAVNASHVWIERQSGGTFSRPEVDIPHSGDSGGEGWNIVEVEKPIARWAGVTFAGSQWVLSGTYFEGFDPSTCSPQPTVSALGDACTNGTPGWAFYKPESHQYEVVSTASALLGPPDNPTVVKSMNFDGCGISYTSQPIKAWYCNSTATPTKIDPTLKTQNIVTSVTVSGSQVCLGTGTVQVCDSTEGGAGCFDVCDLICLCEEFYSLPSEPCEPPPCNCDDCHFEGVSVSLSVQGEQYSGSVSGEPDQSCCYQVPMTGGPGANTIQVCYLGSGSWEAAGNLNSVDFVASGDGDCSGAGVVDSGNSTTGQIDAVSEECTPPPPPPPCGTCTFTWNNSLHEWEITSSDCTSGCVCGNYPQFEGDENTQPQIVNCITNPDCNYCTYRWDGAQWVQIADECDGICVCPGTNALGPGVWPGQKRRVACVQPTVGLCVCEGICDLNQVTGAEFNIAGKSYACSDCPQDQYDDCSWIISITEPGGGTGTATIDWDGSNLQVSVSSDDGGGTGTATGGCETWAFDNGDVTSGQITLNCVGGAAAAARSGGTLGNQFADQHRDWFKGCRCSSDIIPVMNRWEEKPPAMIAIKRLGNLLEFKNRQLYPGSGTQAILDFLKVHGIEIRSDTEA